MADLNNIIQLLDEENIAREVSMYHDLGRSMYVTEKVLVNSTYELIEEAAKFYMHQYECATGSQIPQWYAMGLVENILNRKFSSGLDEAFLLASRGIRGGINAVYDVIYKELKKDHEEQYIRYVFMSNMDILSWEDKIALIEQYLNQFGRYLPQGVQPRSVAELANNPKELILMHMQALNQIRYRLGR